MKATNKFSIVLLNTEFSHGPELKVLIFKGNVYLSECSNIIQGSLIYNFDKKWENENSLINPPVHYEKKLSERHDFEIFKFQSTEDLKSFLSNPKNFGKTWIYEGSALASFWSIMKEDLDKLNEE